MHLNVPDFVPTRSRSENTSFRPEPHLYVPHLTKDNVNEYFLTTSTYSSENYGQDSAYGAELLLEST